MIYIILKMHSMRRLFLPVFILLLFISCNDSQADNLENAFILSIQKNDFNVLKSFLPDKDFYVSQVSKEKKTDAELNEIISNKTEQITAAWQNTLYNVATKKIDLSKVMIKEVFFHDPFPNDTISEAMTINYEYKGNTWDDLQFIVSRKTGKTILLDIPAPTRAFSMIDKDLRATNEAKAWMEMSQPGFKKDLEQLSSKLISDARSNNLNEFGRHLVYHGNDESKRWQATLNMQDTTERQQAAELMQRVNRYLEGCDRYETGNFVTGRKPEGVWIVWPINCGNKIITLAYLRINGQLLLGDIDVELK